MANINTCTIAGNLTRDPELRFTKTGLSVCSFGVAVNYRRKVKGSEEWTEETSFFDVTCWAQLADNVAESIPKGTRVVVTGRLNQRTWETDDGQKRSTVEIVADTVAPSMEWATAEVTRNTKSDNVEAPAPPTPTDEEPF